MLPASLFTFLEAVIESGSPVPVAKGVKPVPGRQPFVGIPEPVMNVDHVSNWGSKLGTPRRGSWVTCQKDEHGICNSSSPMNLNPNTKVSVSRRSSWATDPKREHGIGEPVSPKAFCVASSMVKVTEDKSRMIVKDAKTLTSPFNSVVGKKSVAPLSSQSTRVASSSHSSSKTSLSFNLPQKLSLLGKLHVDEVFRGYLTKDLRIFLRWAAIHLGFSSLAEIEAATPTAELEPIRSIYSQLDEVDMGMTVEELSVYGRLRKIFRCGPVSMFK
ncbi:hypothetical protein M8C21_019396, partial [Ambrosia artemisiifolia]